MDISERAQKHKNKTHKNLYYAKKMCYRLLSKEEGLLHSAKHLVCISNHLFYFTPFRFHFPFPPAFCMSLSVTYFLPTLPWEYTGFNVTYPSLFCSILCTASKPTGSISETEPLVCVGSFILKIPWIPYVLLVSDFLPSSPALCSLLKK